MTDEMETIRGTVENIVYQNELNGYSVIEISSEGELVTAVGSLAELKAGEEVVLHGTYTTHASFGVQFKTEAYEVNMPETVSAVRKYLASGALPYIGKAMAGKIVDKFGENTLEIIATKPEKLAEIKGITLDKAHNIQTEFKRLFGVREAINYLANYDLPATTAVAMFRVYGPDTVTVVNENPYALCGEPAHVQFEKADAIAAELSLEHDSRVRVRAGILYVLRHNLQNGHSCLPRAAMINTVADFIRVEPQFIESEIDPMTQDNDLRIAYFNEKEYIFLPEYYRAEQNIAAHVRFLLKMPQGDVKHADKLITMLETTQGIKYAPLQRQAIMSALQNYALVLTGGPGTGKTTTVNGMLAAFEQNGDRVALAAPTGRAAKRLSELTARKATTIHRLLETTHMSENGAASFVHNEKNKLKCDVVVIDEMSMVDTLLFDSLLAALKPACKIIMVGDEDQLPSVGAGNILGSMMTSGLVPTVRLTEIFRQAAESRIVSNAHRIVSGEEIDISNEPDSDFFLLERDDQARCVELVCDLVSRRLPASYGFDARDDIQVLTPTKIGPLGTVSLNEALQQRLNPPEDSKPQINLRDRILRLGDKVMQTKNNYDIPFIRPNGGEDGAGAFNGDIGVIVEVDKKAGSVTVLCEDRLILYTPDFIRQLEPAYAVTIHKSQGSEYPAIVMPLLDVPPKLCYRNLLYTGVTRARKLCVLCGHAREAMQMVYNVKRNKRFSCLANFLRDSKL